MGLCETMTGIYYAKCKHVTRWNGNYFLIVGRWFGRWIEWFDWFFFSHLLNSRIAPNARNSVQMKSIASEFCFENRIWSENLVANLNRDRWSWICWRIKSIANKLHEMIQKSQTKCIQFEYEALRQEQVHAKTYLRQDKLRQICTNEQNAKSKSGKNRSSAWDSEQNENRGDENVVAFWSERHRASKVKS